MWSAFPTSDYYGPSAPCAGRISWQRAFPTPVAAGCRPRAGTTGRGPTFTVYSVNGIGIQLCPCIIVMVTPRAFTMTSLPTIVSGPEVPHPHTIGDRVGARCDLTHIRQVPGQRVGLRGVQTLVPIRIPLR